MAGVDQAETLAGRSAFIEPLGASIEVGPEETLIEAAWRCGYYWPTVCYGQAQCTACVVAVTDGTEHLRTPPGDEAEALRKVRGLRMPQGTVRRLACRLQIDGPITVEKRGVRPESDAPEQT